MIEYGTNKTMPADRFVNDRDIREIIQSQLSLPGHTTYSLWKWSSKRFDRADKSILSF